MYGKDGTNNIGIWNSSFYIPVYILVYFKSLYCIDIGSKVIDILQKYSIYYEYDKKDMLGYNKSLHRTHIRLARCVYWTH